MILLYIDYFYFCSSNFNLVEKLVFLLLLNKNNINNPT